MSRMSSNDRSVRVLRFLLGVRDQQIASALKRYGFGDEDLKEGWRLLHAVGAGASTSWTAADTEETLLALDEWENEWFPVIQATVERRYPAVHAVLFRNLTQTTGAGVTISVRTLLDRLDQMAAGQGDYGPDGALAMKTLETRGVTVTSLAEPRALLDRLANIATNVQASTEAEAAAAEAAEASLWSWYLEWSRIARVAITSRLLLKRLGFLQGATGAVLAEEEEQEGDGEGGEGGEHTLGGGLRGAGASTANGSGAGAVSQGAQGGGGAA